LVSGYEIHGQRHSFVIVSALAAPALSLAQECSPAVQSQQGNDLASGYGGIVNGKKQAGSQQSGLGHLRRSNGGASGDNCAGPVSYCSIFFGN